MFSTYDNDRLARIQYAVCSRNPYFGKSTIIDFNRSSVFQTSNSLNVEEIAEGSSVYIVTYERQEKYLLLFITS